MHVGGPPECSVVDKHAHSKSDERVVLLAKRTEERNGTIKRIEEQNKLILNGEENERRR